MSVPSGSGPKSVSQEKKTILVVDDSMVMRKAVEIALRKDYALLEAGDGQAGWDQLIANEHIDLVISDIQMPIMDGYSMLCRIRASENSRISDLPVVVITSAEDEVTKERAYACGANDFIVKPIDSSQLVAAIKAHTGVDSVELNQSGLDPLTQVANRERFIEHGRELLAISRINKETTSLVLFEIDRFDQIRAQYGDDVADRVLIWTASTLIPKIRIEDYLGQISNSRFGVLTRSPGKIGSSVLCDRIQAAISGQAFTFEDISINVTLSMGVAYSSQEDALSMSDLMEYASQRVAVARSRGGNSQVGRAGLVPNTVEETVLAAPDLDAALKILHSDKINEIDPYLFDLVLQVLPLIERCNTVFDLELEQPLKSIREKLTKLNNLL